MSDNLLPERLQEEAASPETSPERLVELADHPLLQPIVAANPGTPSALLDHLSKIGTRATRQAVTQNPNTSVALLCALAAEFPEAFLQNPVLPLLNITQPNFVKNLPLLAWEHLLRDEHLSSAWLRVIQRDEVFRRRNAALAVLIQLHVSTGRPVAANWRKQVASEIQKPPSIALTPLAEENTERKVLFFGLLVLLLPQIGAVLKREWKDLLSSAPEEGFLLLAACPTIGETTLAQLSVTAHPAKFRKLILCQIAQHPRTPARTLLELARRRDTSVRCAVAHNPHTPSITIQRLGSDPDPRVRSAAATHHSLSLDDTMILALDEDETVRAAIATLSRLDQTLFELLAEDSCSRVRASLARNGKIPLHLLLLLASDAEANVRAAAASNPRLPLELLTLLSHDPEEEVRASLASNARLSEALYADLLLDPSVKVRSHIASNPRTPSAFLEQLWHSNAMEIWQWLARNPATPTALLVQLAEQGDLSVRIALARNKKTPEQVLHILVSTQEQAIYQALASNPHTPLVLLEQMLASPSLEMCIRLLHHPVMQQHHHRPLLALLAERISLYLQDDILPIWFRHVLWQYHTSFPAQIMAPLATSPHWIDRYLVARHPHIGAELRKTLAHDGISYVRAAAQSFSH